VSALLPPSADLLAWVADLLSQWYGYVLTGLLVLVDGVVGIIPSETVLHAAGVVAARGEASVLVYVLVAALTALGGDVLAYAIGARWGSTLRAKAFSRSDRARRRLNQARGQLELRGWIVTVARFVPALRTLTMYAAGSLGFPRGRFLAFAAVGDTLWATYNVVLGYVVGTVFRRTPFWVSWAVAAGLAAVLAVAFEGIRRLVSDDDADESAEERGARAFERDEGSPGGGGDRG